MEATEVAATEQRRARTVEELRREIDEERRELTSAVAALRSEMRFGTARAQVAIAAAALAAGFVLAGGIGATVRLLFRRARER